MSDDELQELREMISNQRVYIADLEHEAVQIRFPEVVAETLTTLDGAKKYLARLEGALAERARQRKPRRPEPPGSDL